PLRTLAINANGLSDPMKIAAINDVISTTRPHAFVIGETKSAHNFGSHMRTRGYSVYENPGRATGTRNTAKWGVLIGVQQGIFNVQNVPLPETIAGRAIALDLTIPTRHGRSFQHRLIGVYAPWNPGIPDDDGLSFWPTITDTCNSAQFSWSIIGDINATLSVTETTTLPYHITPARLAYNQFLSSTNGVDLWAAQPQHDINSQFTYRPYNQSHSLSTIDRAAASQSPTPSYAPRFRFPSRGQKHRFAAFADIVDSTLSTSDFPTSVITDDESFQQQYLLLTEILLSAAHEAFVLPTSTSQRKQSKPSNPTIRLILRELKRINRLISALNTIISSAIDTFPREPWVSSYFAEFSRTHPSSQHFDTLFRDHLKQVRRNLHKIRFAEERLELQGQAHRASYAKVRNLLSGGSAKQLYDNKFSSLPLALSPAPTFDPANLLTGPENIKNATIHYFKDLYHQTPRPAQQKPWLNTPSVQAVADRIALNPFTWPRPIGLPELRTLLSKGNSKPTPGPDGWEKWFVKYLNDKPLQIIINLLNYIITNSHFPDCIKQTNISTIHKRGPNVFLYNYRGIASQLERWAERENVPLYLLQRDQKKGFDMLEPQGFYDAIKAYGLPSSIGDLDFSSQQDIP
ncbi:hypothetical protein BJ912DRAFT_823476, partial [Pholiota molesta]